MIISSEHLELSTPTGPMRTQVFRPIGEGPWPGIVFFSM